MPKILSVSRRTDIPAFYSAWFLRRLEAGFAGLVNPYNERRYLVSLEPQEVTCFVFWSKNYLPFLDALTEVDRREYPCYFNFTITGLPRVFEPNLVDTEVSVDTLKQLSHRYSPRHIDWRYDPVILSNVTDRDFHLANFEKLASALEGSVERCYFSFVMLYSKVQRSFARLEGQQGIEVTDPDLSFRQDLAQELAEIANHHGIRLYSCCGDSLLSPYIYKAHCVDGALIEDLFHPPGFTWLEKPTRTECGCTQSIDIGAYDTCPHGCAYCYANANPKVAQAAYRYHEPGTAFLGYSQVQSEIWLDELVESAPEDQEINDPLQPTLF
jgi:hypothetical protein